MTPPTSSAAPAANDDPALVCKVCGEAIEALTAANGRETLDLVRFHARHAACLAKSDAHDKAIRLR